MSRHSKVDSRRVLHLFKFFPPNNKHSGQVSFLIALIFCMFCKSGLKDQTLCWVHFTVWRFGTMWTWSEGASICKEPYKDSVSPSLLGQVPWQQNSWLPKQLWTRECTRYTPGFTELIGFVFEIWNALRYFELLIFFLGMCVWVNTERKPNTEM